MEPQIGFVALKKRTDFLARGERRDFSSFPAPDGDMGRSQESGQLVLSQSEGEASSAKIVIHGGRDPFWKRGRGHQ